MQRIAIPAQRLQQRLAQDAPQLGAIASAGEWPLPYFRRVVVPMMVAVVRRIDGLPAPVQDVHESGSAWVLVRALRVLRAFQGNLLTPRQDSIRQQLRTMAAALVAAHARIDEQWMAVSPDGHRLGGGAEPLSACVVRLGLPRYYAQPRPAEEANRADRTGSAFAWLIRDLPAGVLCDLAGEHGDELPWVLSRARELRETPVIHPSVEADAMTELVRSGCWRVNRRKGRLWWIDRRLFLVWRTGAREIAHRCAAAGRADSAADALLARLQALGIRGGVHARSTPWTPAIDVVELDDPAYWLALAACVDQPAEDTAARAVAVQP